MTVQRPLSRVAFLLAVATIAPQAARAAWGPGWQLVDLASPPGAYALGYVPPGLPPGPVPAVVFLHGQGSSPDGWRPLLEPVADELGVVLLVPRSDQPIGWGVGADDLILVQSLGALRAGVDVDPARLGIAGHSAGGAYAIEYAYSTRAPFVAVFALASPYRTVVRLADPTGPPPLRLYYGTQDANYVNGAGDLLSAMLTARGVAVTPEVAPGFGHSTWPASTLRDGFAFLVGQPRPACLPGPTALCLRDGRFRVEATWDTGTAAGAAQGSELSDESGTFWFFSPQNLELDVKVLAGCPVNGRFWVFAAGLTDVGVTLAVTDTASGQRVEYRNPRGTPFAPIQDTGAFATCP
jgi:pimeloyl-ACP methyl ester carboxylesterase